MAKKKTKKKVVKKRQPKPPSSKDYDEAIRLSCEATTKLAKKIARSQKLIVAGRDYQRGIHQHREPTQEQVGALSAAIDTAVAAADLCASLHPQGCPPHLQLLTSHLDEACMMLQEAQRYAWRRFRGPAPEPRRRRY